MSPSPFIVEWLGRIARGRGASTRLGAAADGRALDIAMGRGRHALPLARAGFRTFGVDRNFDAVRDAVRSAFDAGTPIAAWCADLTVYSLPTAAFDLLVITRYLQRDLVPSI